LRSIENVEAKPIGDPDIDEKLLGRARWLEEYNAFELYRLARTSWESSFRNSSDAGVAIKSWETGRGDPLFVGDSFTRRLHFQLFELILPKVTKLIVGSRGNYYLLPPKRKWKYELKKWNSFITAPSGWSIFTKFVGEVEGMLCDLGTNTRFLNERFESKFSDFSNEELKRLITILDRLAAARDGSHQTALSSSDLALFARSLDIAGDLSVVRFHNWYKLSELAGRN
jgi:hypothetical protein